MSHATARPLPARAAAPRTLWEEGTTPGPRVVATAVVAATGLAWLNVTLTGRLSLFFDLSFVVLCLVAALAVHPRDLFAVGVLPPLLLLGVVTMLAVASRASVAEEADSLVQAVVTGLAHHAGGLVAAYGPTLAILAVRQVVVRGRGRPRRA